MNRNCHGYSLSSLLQQISYFKNDVVLTYGVILGENDVIRQDNVIFNIENHVHRLPNEYPKVFLLINRFKSDFKSVNC